MTVGSNGGFLKLKRLEHERHRQVAEIEAAGKLYRIVLPLAGEFQMANALVAAGLARSRRAATSTTSCRRWST